MSEQEPPGAVGLGIDRASAFFGPTRAQRLYEELRGGGLARMKPRVTPGIVVAHGIAALVHLLSIALLLAGIALILWTWPAWLGVILGAAMAIAGWFLLPELGRIPDHVVSRDAVPTLYALTDEIAAALGTPPVDLIALSPDENASFQRVGLRRTSVLTLGLPLWGILGPQERVSLIAHELAHQQNGDTGRRFLVAHALSALQGWHEVLTQESVIDQGPLEFLVKGVLEVVALIVESIASVLVRLYWSESQRAEYLADHLGSRVSGTDAFIATNDRLLALSAYPEALFDATMKTPARDPDYGAIFDRFVALFRSIPAARADAARIRADLHHEDGTHPPTAYRSALLADYPCAPIVTLDPKMSDAIDAELAPFASDLGLMLVRRWAYFFA